MWMRALEGLDRIEQEWAAHERRRPSRALSVLMVAMLVATGLAVAARSEAVRTDDTTQVPSPELVVEDPAPTDAVEAAGAAPGDPVTLTVVVETVTAAGTPSTSTQPFDVTARSARTSITPLPALDSDPFTSRPSEAAVTVVAGEVSLAIGAPSGWRTRSVRCGTTDLTPVYDLTSRSWVVTTTVLATTTCRVVQSDDGGLVTVVTRTVDRAGDEVASAADGTLRFSSIHGTLATVVVDTDPFSAVPSSTTVAGPTGRWTIMLDSTKFGPLTSVVCDGREVPLVSQYPSGQLPKAGVVVDVVGPTTCIFTQTEMEGLHTLQVVHRSIDEAGLDVTSSESVTISALTNEGSGTNTFTLDNDPTTTTPDRFTVSHFASVARIGIVSRAGWRVASVVCDGRSWPLDATGLVANVPLVGDTVCVVTSLAAADAAPSGSVTVVLRTVDADGNDIEATDPIDAFQFFAFDFDAWFGFATLDTNPATADGNRTVLEPPASSQIFLQAIVPVDVTRAWQLVDFSCTDGTQGSSGVLQFFTIREPVTCTATMRLTTATTLQVEVRTVDRNGFATTATTVFGPSGDVSGTPVSFLLDTDPTSPRGSSESQVVPVGDVTLNLPVPFGWRFSSFVCDTVTPVVSPYAQGRSATFPLRTPTSCILTMEESAIQLELQLATLDAAGGAIDLDQFVRIVAVSGSQSSSSFLDTSPRTPSTIDAAVVDSVVGSHVLTVEMPRGWVLASVVCDGRTAVTNLTTATIDLDGDSRCVVTLQRRAAASFVIALDTVDAAGAPAVSSGATAVVMDGPLGISTQLDSDPASTRPNSAALSGPAGSYTFQVTAPAGWRTVALTCNDQVPAPRASGWAVDVTDGTSCIVQLRREVDAVIDVVIATLAPGGTVGTTSGDAFGVDRTGDAVADLVLDTDPASVRSDRASITVAAGTTATLTSIVPAGWRLSDVSCAGGAVTVTQDVAGAPTGIRVTPTGGASITCTFRHLSSAAALGVSLQTTDESGRVVTTDTPVTVVTSAAGSLTLDTDAATSRPSVVLASIAPSATPVTIVPVVPTGWRLDAVSCSGETAGIAGGVSTVVAAGARVDCIVSLVRANEGAASLGVRVVVEAADGSAVPSPIDITVRGTGRFGTAVLDTDDLDPLRAATIVRSVAAGPSTLVVDAVPGHSLRSVICAGATTSTERRTGGVLDGVDLTLGAGQSAECVVVLRADTAPAGTLTVRLEGQFDSRLIGGPGDERFAFEGTGGIGRFELDFDTTSAVPQQQTFSVPAGSYTVAELVIPGAVRSWDLVDIACNAGATVDVNGGTTGQPGLLGTTVTIPAGTDVTCSFVNNARGITLDVFHRTTDVNGFRTFEEQDFSYSIARGTTGIATAVLDGGNGGPSDSFRVEVLAGTYRVTVDPVATWTPADVSCDELATPVYDQGVLVGVDVVLGTLSTTTFLSCTFVHRRDSVGSGTASIQFDTRAADDITRSIEATGQNFTIFLTTAAGEVVYQESADTDPATPADRGTSTELEAGTYVLVLGLPLSTFSEWKQPFGRDCGDAALTFVSLGRDVTGDQAPDSGFRFTLAPGSSISCSIFAQANEAPSSVAIRTRILDAAGATYRYDRSITYSVSFPGETFESVTVATTDNFDRSARGAPGPWRITLTPPSGLSLIGIRCTDRLDSSVVTTTPVTDARGTGASLVTRPGSSFDCFLELRVVAEGRLTIVSRTIDDTGAEVATTEDFAMAVQPFAGGFSIDTSAADIDDRLFEEYTNRRVMALPPGTYTFLQGTSPNFALQDFTCTGPGSAGVVISRNATRITGATIPIATGDDIVCTAQNDEAATTSLSVRVNTITSDGRLYQDPTRFTFTEPGGSFELASQAGGGVPTDRTISIPANRPVRITEALPEGWLLTDITCSLGSVTTIREGGVIVGMEIEVAPNERPVCSFSNTGDLARVTLIAATERDGASVPSAQEFRIGGGAAGPFTLDTSPATSVPDRSSATVVAGSLTLRSETVTGWVLDRVTCVEASARPSFTVTAATDGATVDVQAGDQITCTFVHREDIAPPVNRVPVCQPLVLTVETGTSGTVAPSCVDPDGDPLTYTVAGAPTKGSASVVSGSLRFTADPGSSGADSFTYTASDGTGGTSDPATVSVTITTPPPPPVLPVVTVTGGSVVEGTGAGSSVVSFTVQLSADAPAGGVSVGYATSAGSAGAADFTVVSGTAEIPAGSRSVTVEVPITRDALDESDESFTLSISNPTGATIGAPSSATGTIVDDDDPTPPPPVLPVVTVTGGSVVEGTGAGSSVVSFTVLLSADAPAGGVSVGYATSTGTANSSDFTATSGTAQITAGSRSMTIDVPVSRDAIDELDESFTLAISNPTGATIGAPSSATGTIVDDDDPTPPPPSVEVSLDTWWICIDEGDGQHGSSFEFVITLSEPAPAGGVTVRYRTVDGLAVGGEDYEPLDDRLIIPAGQVRAFVQVHFIGDDLVEEHEDFFLELVSTSANAVIGVDRRSRGVIANDDW